MFLHLFCPSSAEDSGELYVWGSNKHGQLASQAAFLPVPQKIEAHCFQNEKVTAVWSGWTHLVAQTGKRATENLWSVRVAGVDSCLNSYECSGLSMLVFTDEKLLEFRSAVIQVCGFVPWITGLHPKK